ncbi:MAG: hypothetical protein ACTSW2_02870 [Alphaproteobacteria bacterium]
MENSLSPEHNGRNWSKRLPLGLVLVLSAMFLAFAAGGWFYSVFLVQSTGFAGAAEAVMSGSVSALGIGALSAVLVCRLTLRRLFIAAFGTLAMAVVIFAVLFIRMKG